jgi:hypothetical protein
MRGRRRVVALAAGGSVLAIALGVGTALLTEGDMGDGGVDDDTLAIPRTADPYPTPSAFSQPPNCGVRTATLDKVLPGGGSMRQEDGTCRFDIDYGSRSGWQGSLTVGLLAGRSSGPNPSVADAMGLFEATADRGAWQDVSGLGDEAAVHHDGNLGITEVVLRVQGVRAHIVYSARRTKGFDRKPLDEKPSVDNALLVAADVASALGGEVDSPTVGSQPASAPALHAPDACDLIPAATLRKLHNGDDPKRLNLPPNSDGSTDTCDWYSIPSASGDSVLSLSVSVETFSDDGQASGERKAARKFLKTYYEAREGEYLIGDKAGRRFHPLSGPGNEALGYYYTRSGYRGPEVEREGCGVIVFRVRNIVVEVSYEGAADGKPLGEAAALNRAYLAAKDAAAALSG